MIMTTVMFPMMFLSGIFFPIKMMPGFMQTISSFLPLTYASDAMRKVMVLGADVTQITTDLASTDHVRRSDAGNRGATVQEDDDPIRRRKREHTLFKMSLLPASPDFEAEE